MLLCQNRVPNSQFQNQASLLDSYKTQCKGKRRKFHLALMIWHVLPAYETEGEAAQRGKMKNVSVLKCLYVDARSMENKQQALEKILNNEVYELVGTAEARWADSFLYFECQ